MGKESLGLEGVLGWSGRMRDMGEVDVVERLGERMAYFCPLGMKIGERWSAPPPVGRRVSRTATRLLMGATG